MASLPDPTPLVRDYMSYFSAVKNDPFNGDYAAVLVTYVIDVEAPTAVPTPPDIS